MLIKLHITLLAESMLMCIIVRSICRSPSMADTSFSFRKHRRLPGQSELDESTWADLDGADDDHYWAEVRAVDLDRRRAEVKVAENFKALRLRLDLTQTDMAQRLGLSLRSLQMYERGERPISSDILADLYVQFDIDLHQLFTASPREPSREWREALTKQTLEVADEVAKTFPQLEAEEQHALTALYMRSAIMGEKIDGGDLLACHSQLFKPEDDFGEQ